jgi:hypothetical protein
MEASSKCTNCNQSNSTNANYCSNCGTSFNFNTQKKGKGDKLIFATVLILSGVTLYWLLLDRISDFTSHEIYDSLYYLNRLLDLTWVGMIFLLVFSIQSIPLRTASLILAIVYACIRLYWLIDDIIGDFSYDAVDYFQF